MEELLLNLVVTTMTDFPGLSAIVLLFGMVFVIEVIVRFTRTKRDDRALKNAKRTKIYKFFNWILDYVTSRKLRD